MSVGIRRAGAGDVELRAELLAREEAEPYLAPLRPREPAAIRAALERSQREPAQVGLLVIGVDGKRAGTMRFEATVGRSRIANLGAPAILPDFRGRRRTGATAPAGTASSSASSARTSASTRPSTSCTSSLSD